MALGWGQSAKSYYSGLTLLKKLFWIYFLLLIFEGALRKWILPQYSAPLLVIRDPVGMLIIFEAYRTNKWPERWTVITGILAVGLLGLCLMQVLVGGNPWVAALYGLRSDLLPFPVAFIMGENLDAEDLRKFGVCTLWLWLPEAALCVAQYLAPSSSLLNVGAYRGGAQIGYVGAGVRASGTFSFDIGPALFGPLAAVFVLYGLVREKLAKKWLLWAVAGSLVLSVPIVGSRTFLAEVGAVVACAGIAAALGVSQFFKMIKIIIPLAAVFFLVSFLPIFSQSSKNLNERVRTGNRVEGGGSFSGSIIGRTVGPLWTRIEETDFSSNPIGLGMGRGAAAVTKLLLGKTTFLAGEGEIDRTIVELGPFPGLAFTLFRFGLALTILGWALSRARDGEPLALLFAPLMFSGVALGILEQPTDQGFMVIGLAFCLAATKKAGMVVGPAPILPPRRRLVGASHRPRRWTD